MPEARPDLRADCTRCFGLCCVVPALVASADFAINKPAGRACPQLRADFRCSIHNELRPRGFSGCAAYDCFGAGQKVAQITFGGRDWRHTPEIAATMFHIYPIMRNLHELLWYLAEALTLGAATALHGELRQALTVTERLSRLDPDALAGLDVSAHRDEIATVLRRTSELVRANVRRTETELAGADLVGKNLSGADLSGASLRSAYLVGADLTGADLSLADLIGADLRGAELSRANLATSIFLTQFQVNTAKGDLDTRLPRALARPPHWQAQTMSRHRALSGCDSPEQW